MYKALIIGAGQIAGGYDSPESEKILTHAHAIKLNNKIDLLGFYDINYDKAKLTADKWKTNVFKSVDEVKKADIVSICTPDFCHLHSIKQALNLNPKIIILEKPVSNSIKDTNEIYEISKKIPILVNYTRNFVIEFRLLADEIKQGKYGEFITGTGYYGKGYIHIGSHMRKLLELLLGPISIVSVDKQGYKDYTEDDLTRNAVLNLNGKTFNMIGLPCYNYNIFEIDLLFSKSRIRITNLGNDVEIYNIKEKEDQKGYLIIHPHKTYKTGMDVAMQNMFNNAVNHLEKNEPLLCPVNNAL